MFEGREQGLWEGFGYERERLFRGETAEKLAREISNSCARGNQKFHS
jgi:hypothetical protein